MAERQFRAGAIGRTGAGNYGHGLHLAYRDIAQVDFVAIADPDPTGRARAAEESGALRTYADFRDMLGREALDIVSVCPRWVDCHEEMILACIEAGCHVYSEKPMAMDPASADRLIEAAEHADVKIAVAHQGVYLPQIQAIRTLLVDGRIGTLLRMEAAGKQDRRGGGEDMMVLGTHLLNMMRFFAGNPSWVWARVMQDGHGMGPLDVREAGEPIGPIAGDDVVAVYGFENDVVARFISRADQPGGGQGYGLVLIGEKGRIAMSGGGNAVAVCDRDVWAPWTGGHTWEPLDVPMGSLHQDGNRLAAEDLIGAIEGGCKPISSARDARWALEMILGAYASELARARISLPLKDRMHPLEALGATD